MHIDAKVANLPTRVFQCIRDPNCKIRALQLSASGLRWVFHTLGKGRVICSLGPLLEQRPRSGALGSDCLALGATEITARAIPAIPCPPFFVSSPSIRRTKKSIQSISMHLCSSVLDFLRAGEAASVNRLQIVSKCRQKGRPLRHIELYTNVSRGLQERAGDNPLPLEHSEEGWVLRRVQERGHLLLCYSRSRTRT